MSMERKRERITIRITKKYARLLDVLVNKGIYNSRNEAIRDAMRLLFEHHGLKLMQRDSRSTARGSGNPSERVPPS